MEDALEALDCVVSPEWAAAVASMSTGQLEAPLARPDLWQEYKLLEKLMYKNANQHRGAQHYQRLQEVRRLLALLKSLQLDRRVRDLHGALERARHKGVLPTGSVLLAYGGDQRRVPAHQAAAAVLHRLRAACRLVEQLGPAVHRASMQLLAQLAHSFFMPFCLVSLTALARIQVLAGQLMLDAVRAYNLLAELAALLPPSPAAAAAAAADAAAVAGATSEGGDAELPQLLRAQWHGGLPRLESVPCAAGDSLAAQAAAACARYALHLVQPKAVATATVLEEAAAPQAGQQRRRGRAVAAAPAGAPVLAVVEDRGVPISREAFAASAAALAAVPAGAAAAQAGVAVAVAAAAAPVAAAAAAPAEPLVLGVVEEIEPDRPTGRGRGSRRSGSGTEVSSLMQGESRGHLYCRTALGLGQLQQGPARLEEPRPASKPAPAGAAAAAPMQPAAAAGAAPPRQEGRVVGAAAGAMSAGAAPAARPKAAVAAAAGDRKPAFVAAGAASSKAAPKPAFLSVAVPPATAHATGAPAGAQPPVPPAQPQGAPAASQPAAPLAAEVAAAAAATPATQPAAPLALAGGGRRKRKKPAAVAAEQQQQQQQQQRAAEDAAAAPKSWEDWLEPLGSTASASEASASLARQPGGGKQQQGKRRRGR